MGASAEIPRIEETRSPRRVYGNRYTTSDPRRASVLVRLTDTERACLQREAAHRGTTVGELVRSALVMAGVLPEDTRR